MLKDNSSLLYRIVTFYKILRAKPSLFQKCRSIAVTVMLDAILVVFNLFFGTWWGAVIMVLFALAKLLLAFKLAMDGLNRDPQDLKKAFFRVSI